MAGNYGEAGALDLYGEAHGLPPVISSSNSLWYRGCSEFEPEVVIVVGFERDYAGHFFEQCKWVDTVKTHHGVKNEETNFHAGLYVCSSPRRPWSEMWKDFQVFQ